MRSPPVFPAGFGQDESWLQNPLLASSCRCLQGRTKGPDRQAARSSEERQQRGLSLQEGNRAQKVGPIRGPGPAMEWGPLGQQSQVRLSHSEADLVQ